MDDLGFNKIAAAVLATALGFMLIKEVPHLLMHAEAPETPAYSVGKIETASAGEVEDLPFPQATFVDAMDAERGVKVFKKCTSCHNADNGGANGTGPNLWNIVGQPAGKKAGFKYSGSMANAGLTWDYESLDGFLKKPTKYLSGTNMNFVGLKKEADRAAVIEYLRQQSGSPIAKPVAIVAEAEVTEVPSTDGTIEAIQQQANELIDNAPELTAPVQKEGLEGTVKDVIKETIKEGGH